MTRYVISSRQAVIAEGRPDHTGGPMIHKTAHNTGYFLGCCGLAGLSGFNNHRAFENWNDEAEFVACLYRNLYVNGTVVYTLARSQLDSSLHRALQSIGSTQVAEFPNLSHGPQMLHMFKVNIRNACGRYCNKYGEAYAEKPADDREVLPEQTTPISGDWMFLPVKK